MQDTGYGISDKDQKKLFKLFGKITDTDFKKNMNTSGIGLGLHICKKIVE